MTNRVNILFKGTSIYMYICTYQNSVSTCTKMYKETIFKHGICLHSIESKFNIGYL